MAFRPPEYTALISPITNAFAFRFEGQGEYLTCPFCVVLSGRRRPSVKDWSPRHSRDREMTKK